MGGCLSMSTSFFHSVFFSCRLCITEHYASFFDVSRGAMIPVSVATWPTDQLDYDLSNQHLQRAQLDRSYGCDKDARLKAADRGLSAACRPLCPYAPVLSSFLRAILSCPQWHPSLGQHGFGDATRKHTSEPRMSALP